VQNGAKRQKCVLSGYPRSSLEFFTSKNVADFQLVVLLQLASCEYVRRLFATRLEKPLTEVSKSGKVVDICMPLSTVVNELREATSNHHHHISPGEGKDRAQRGRIPIRDFHRFFRQNAQNKIGNKILGHVHGVHGKQMYQAAILPRAASSCFLLDVEHITLTCTADKCWIVHPEQDCGLTAASAGANCGGGAHTVEQFVVDLAKNVQNSSHHPATGSVLWREGSLSVACPDLPFEMMVLETSLSHVSARLRKQCAMMHSLLEVLTEETLSANPPDRVMLRRTLAFKQTLKHYEKTVYSIAQAVQNVLNSDQDMADLYLTENTSGGVGRSIDDHDEVELLLESYASDLQTLALEVSRMRASLEDTDDFVNIHLSTKRNEIIRLSLFMDMATLSLASGAVVAGGFGMNLTHGLEDHPTAFCITSGATVALMTALFGLLMRRFRLLDLDSTSRARTSQYHALKNFQAVVDGVEARLTRGDANTPSSMTRSDFEALVNSIVPGAQPDEIDLIFKSLDLDRSGSVENQEILNSRNRASGRFRMKFKGH